MEIVSGVSDSPVTDRAMLTVSSFHTLTPA
jgi:hypothetical protein